MKHLVMICVLLTMAFPGREAAAVTEKGPAADSVRLVAQLGHAKSLGDIAISPDGRLLLTGSEDNTAKLWALASGLEIRTFQGHSNGIGTVAFSPDGRRVLTGSLDKTARLWNTDDGREIRALRGHSDAVDSAAFSPDGRLVLTGSADTTARLWDVATGRTTHTLTGHAGGVTHVAFSPDGRLALTGSDDGTARLWEVATARLLQVLKGHAGSITGVAFSSAGRRVLTGGQDETIRLWDVTGGNEIRSYRGYPVAFSPDGEQALIGTNDGEPAVMLLDLAGGTATQTSLGNYDDFSKVAFAPDRRHVVTNGKAENTACLREIMTGRELRIFQGTSLGITGVALSSDGRNLLTGTTEKSARLWNLETGRQTRTFRIRTSAPITGVAFSPEGRSALIGNYHGAPHLVEIESGREIRTFERHGSAVTGVAFSFDGRLALTGSFDHSARLWDVATGEMLRTFEGHEHRIFGIAFSPDARLAVTGSEDTTAILWDVAGGDRKRIFEGIRTFAGHHGAVAAVAFSRDGGQLLTGSDDKTARLWEVSTGRTLRVFEGHSAEVTSVAFSPDGRMALTGSLDNTARLWDLATGAPIRTISGHTGGITGAIFSADGRLVITGSLDGTSRFWEAATGRPLATLISFTDGTWVVVDPAGRFDTNNLEEIKGLHWIMPDDPLTPLPVETFLREYYEPRLFPRILNGDAFKPVKDLIALNRVLPIVAVSSVTREGKGDTVTVTVQVGRQRRKIGDRYRETGAADLKLFRAGQLVGFTEGNIDLKSDGTRTITYGGIRLPRKAGTKEVEFSAYAFNDDGIKSLTGRAAFVVPNDLTPAKGKAYLVAIGVNRYQNAAWNLQYAAGDAQKIRQSLESRILKVAPYTDVIPIVLTDESATKENIRAVFDLLSGKPVSPDLVRRIPNAGKLAKATPEDLLIVAFSGHGHVDENGVFYSFTHDTGPGDGKVVTPDLLAHIISGEELSRWLRYLDAGDMAMIVDACHSAATVGEGFKPGPMGSRGLGQLAYDKGMRILAASQADDVALESDKLQQGLLTYALVHDGLEAFQADFQPVDKAITLSELLAYAVERVPKLYAEVKSGDLSTFGRGETSRAAVIRLGDRKKSSLQRKNPYQTPALFDFARKRKGDVVIAGE